MRCSFGILHARACGSQLRSQMCSSHTPLSVASRFFASTTSAGPTRTFAPQTEKPKWESGELEVLMPKYRLRARLLKSVVREAEARGYIVLRSHPRVEPSVYPPVMKSEKKEAVRIKKRQEKIQKGLQGMEKRRDAMHKKDRDERYSAKMKGLARLFPEQRAAPKKKGMTYYKKRRLIKYY